jgi:hypothetical protein
MKMAFHFLTRGDFALHAARYETGPKAFLNDQVRNLNELYAAAVLRGGICGHCTGHVLMQSV